MVVVTPWMLLLAGVLASRDDEGAVAVVNPWILVLAGVFASSDDGVL